MLRSQMEKCVQDVMQWSGSKRLQMNTSKTEVMWFGSHASMKKLSSTDTTLQFLGQPITPSTVVRDLGVYLDSTLDLHDHVSKLAQSSFYTLRRLRSIRNKISRDDTVTLVVSLVFSRLDYCNAILAGLPASTLAPLQRVQNAAARLVFELKPHDHITSSLRDLHWLPIVWRIKFKLCVLVHRAVYGCAPSYIAELITPSSNTSLRSSSRGDLLVPRTRLHLGERAFSVSGPREWNQLPPDIRLISNAENFKARLKTFMFNLAFV